MKIKFHTKELIFQILIQISIHSQIKTKFHNSITKFQIKVLDKIIIKTNFLWA